MRRNALIIAVLALLLAILGVLAHKLARRPLPVAETLAVSSCDPGMQTCSAALPGGGHLELSITPRPARPLQPLDLSVRISGLEAHRVELDFAGRDMQMGYNRPVLSGADGQFSGRTTLPVCVSGSMVWIVTALLSAGNSRIAIPFRFTVAAR
jgi:hypothetical protein